MFDSGKTGKIENEKVRTILNIMGHTFDDLVLETLLEQEDKEGKVSKSLFKYSLSVFYGIGTNSSETVTF